MGIYEDTLLGEGTREQVFDANWDAPSYMRVMEIHNTGNRNLSREQAESSVIEDIPKFIFASLASGSAQLYNILPSIGNMLGGDFETADIHEVMQAIDDDLAIYYQDHQTAVDTVGFILSSFVPGMAGIKGLRAVQSAGALRLEAAMRSGRIGQTTGKALGLLAPSREKHIRAAIQQFTTSNTPFQLTERNLMKAMGAGLGQNILEATAFEVAVAATLSASPVLENQDMEDLAKNIFVGGVVFGAVGGVIDATRGVFKVKGAIKDAAKEGMPWTHYEVPVAATSTEDKIAMYWEQATNIPEIPKAVSAERADFLKQAAGKKQERLFQLTREELGNLAGGDQQVAEQMFSLLNQGSGKNALEDLLGLKSLSRLSEKDKIAKAVEKLQKKQAKGTASVQEVEDLLHKDVAYIKAYGEDAGEHYTVKPITTSLADTLKRGELIEVNQRGVFVTRGKGGKVVQEYKFNADPRKPWSFAHASVEESSARHIWAQQLDKPLQELPEFTRIVGGKKVYKTPIVAETDIPLLEKMYRDFQPGMKVKLRDDTFREFSSSDDFFKFLMGVKHRGAMELNSIGSQGIFLGSKEAVIERLRSITGIDFVVRDTGSDSNIAKMLRVSESAREIVINERALMKLPLHRLVQSLKHEEGHQLYDLLIKLGDIPTDKLDVVRKEMTKASKKIRKDGWKAAATDPEYAKYLSRDHELMADTFAYFSQFPERVGKEAPEWAALYANSTEGGRNFLKPIPPQVVKQYMARAQKMTQEEMASILNVRNTYLSGQVSQVPQRDMFAMQSIAEEHTENLIAAGIRKPEDGIVATWKLPTYLRATYDRTPVQAVDGNLLRGMAAVKERQRLHMKTTDRAVASVLEEDFAKLPDITDQDILRAAPIASSGGFASAASGNYGTLASKVQYIGNQTTVMIKKFQEQTRDVLTPAIQKLVGNQKAYLEWSVLNNNLRAIPDQYVLNDDGTALIPRVIAEYDEALAAGVTNVAEPVLRAADAPLEIPLQTAEVRELARLHIARNGKRVDSIRALKTAQGSQYTWKNNVFYPVPVKTADYKHFALVRDETITGVGAKKMIYANSEQELEAMIAKLAGEPGLKVYTKSEMERFFKSIDDFEYEHTFSENWLDTALYRKGVSSSYFASTDPAKISAEIMDWHMGAEASLVRGTVKTKYERAFAELHALGDAYTNAATSRYGNSSLLKHADDVVNNPYVEYERTALGLKNYAKYPWWTNPNTQVDAAISKMYERITGVVEGSRTVEELDQINTILKEVGYKGAAYDESMELLANHTAPRGALSSFVAKANGILATVVLRLDALNAVNNAVGATVLRATEMQAVIRAIRAGDEDAVGELVKLAYVKTPGTGDHILAPSKLVAKALHNFHNEKHLKQFYRDHGFMTTISDQYKQTLDTLTLTGKESVKELDDKIATVVSNLRKAADTGEKWTGNRLAEEFNRFISADIMRQMTDILVKRGQMDDRTALAYINTFVNRVEGNYLAAQRPMMFQGPIGQAVGLFQTYQFNLMQQLLRHVGEGHAKDAMTLLGMQATIYGMNGLPGFNAINTHIVGSASGNDKHRDFYDVTYGIAGKEAGDWLTYGVASNLLLHPDLKVNLYVRGDINPRHLTLVPTDPASVPIVQATGKFLANVKRTVQRLGAGGDPWTTILQGLEHNSISRPLSGLAQTLEAATNGLGQSYSTSKKGNVIAANDFLSLANLGRLVGGKPLDEAIAIDAAFRYKTYALKDAKKREILGAAIKSTMLAGEQPSQEMIEEFAASYAALGGSQSEFNRWFMQLYRTANTSQANKLIRDLDSPFSQSMQKIMGGYELADFDPQR